MKKEMNAAYYDAVVSKSAQHNKRWRECGRRGDIVILERVEHGSNKKQNDTKSDAKADGVDMPKVRKGKRPGRKKVQPQNDGNSDGGS